MKPIYDELRQDHGWGLIATCEQVAAIFDFGDRIESFKRLIREGNDDVFVKLREIKVTAGRTTLFPTQKVAELIEELNR